MSPAAALSWMLSGELAGSTLPASCLRLGSSAELSAAKRSPQCLSLFLVCVSFPSVLFGEVTAGHRSGQCECESRMDAVTPQGLCWSLCPIGVSQPRGGVWGGDSSLGAKS